MERVIAARRQSATAETLAGALVLAVGMGFGRFAFTGMYPLMVRDGALGVQGGSLAASANYLGYLAGALLLSRIHHRHSAALCRIAAVGTVLCLAALAPPWGNVYVYAMRFAAGLFSALAMVTASMWLFQSVGFHRGAPLLYAGVGAGILLSAGEARGESPVLTTVAGFVDGVVGDWRRRTGANLEYHKVLPQDPTIVSDSALKQILVNVLDNALEASPDWVGLTVVHDGETLTLSVRDRGPGFAREMLERFGKPYQSSKGRPGGGLGLFLVVNVVRKLGGRVAADNPPEGGARVSLFLPLAALRIEQEEEAVADD